MHGYLKIRLDLFWLFYSERHAVSALTLGRIRFVGIHGDGIQRAVLTVLGNVFALYNCAADVWI